MDSRGGLLQVLGCLGVVVCGRICYNAHFYIEAGDRMQERENTQVRIAILFSGSGSNLENIVAQQKDIAAALSPYHITPHIVLAISNNPSAYGIARCKRLGLECKVIDHRDFGSRALFDQALAQCLESHHIDLVVLAGFMRILGEEFVEKFRAINIHPSFLPLHKGAHAIADSFNGAEEFGGVSVHWVSLELDSGAIIVQEKLPKIAGESLQDFESRIHFLEHKLYPKAIAKAIIQAFGSGAKTIGQER